MMRHLGLAVAVLTVVFAATDEDTKQQVECKPLGEISGSSSLTYSPSSSNGKHTNGTTVTLSCSSGPVVGRSESRCDDGKWIPKIGYCGSNCSQQLMKPLGYTEMLIDGKQTEGDAPHHSTVEFNCGNERHKYYCYDGTFHPKHTFDPCGSCSAAKVAGLGYAGMSVNGNTLNGHLVEGSVVALGCRDEFHWFSCTKGQLQPIRKSESICGCTAPGNTTADHDRYVFTTSPKDGLYESGTEVALFCKSGPVVGGPSESVCQGGDWNPPLGRCPEMCDKDDLTKMNFDNTKLSEPEETNLQYHGGKASATCTANSTTASYNMTCIDGDWWLRWTL